jgi:hypothetical protein
MDLATFTFFTTISVDMFRSDFLRSASVAVKEEERRIVRYVKINVLLQLKLNLLYG